MADFRDISQEYAKEAIRTVLALNSGAAGVLLTQAVELRAAGLADEVSSATFLWTLGASLAAACWIVAFLSTRYVDKAEIEGGSNLDISNWLMLAGLTLAIASLVLFMVGCYSLASGLGVML